MNAAILLTLLAFNAPSPSAPDDTSAPPSSDAFTDPQANFQAAMKLVKDGYVDATLSDERLYEGAVQGMLAHAGGRAWDQLISPSEMADMKSSLAGEIVGIGIEPALDETTGVLMVKRTIPGSAAERAGLVAGDQILKVDGRSVKGWSLHDVVDAIRGKEGEAVELTLLRDATVSKKSIRREKITLESVEDAVLPGDVGYLAIHSFDSKTSDHVHASLARLAAAKVGALVVDLRGCPGGLFDAATSVGDQLLPAGKTIVTEVARGGERNVFTSKGTGPLSVPIAVLVDSDTASGGEILAGALKESAGAELVGGKTFGKWNVQRIESLPNGFAIKFTVGTFETPSGDRPDGKGLIPDLEVTSEAGVARHASSLPVDKRLAADPQLRVAVATIRR